MLIKSIKSEKEFEQMAEGNQLFGKKIAGAILNARDVDRCIDISQKKYYEGKIL